MSMGFVVFCFVFFSITGMFFFYHGGIFFFLFSKQMASETQKCVSSNSPRTPVTEKWDERTTLSPSLFFLLDPCPQDSHSQAADAPGTGRNPKLLSGRDCLPITQ